MDVGDMTMGTVRTGLGIRAAKRYDLGGMVAETEVRVRWDHDFLDRAADSRVALAGAPFQVSGTEAGRDAAVLGTGFVAYLENSLEGFAGYDVELREGSSAHRVSAGLRYRLP